MEAKHEDALIGKIPMLEHIFTSALRHGDWSISQRISIIELFLRGSLKGKFDYQRSLGAKRLYYKIYSHKLYHDAIIFRFMFDPDTEVLSMRTSVIRKADIKKYKQNLRQPGTNYFYKWVPVGWKAKIVKEFDQSIVTEDRYYDSMVELEFWDVIQIFRLIESEIRNILVQTMNMAIKVKSDRWLRPVVNKKEKLISGKPSILVVAPSGSGKSHFIRTSVFRGYDLIEGDDGFDWPKEIGWFRCSKKVKVIGHQFSEHLINRTLEKTDEIVFGALSHHMLKHASNIVPTVLFLPSSRRHKLNLETRMLNPNNTQPTMKDWPVIASDRNQYFRIARRIGVPIIHSLLKLGIIVNKVMS